MRHRFRESPSLNGGFTVDPPPAGFQPKKLNLKPYPCRYWIYTLLCEILLGIVAFSYCDSKL